MKERERISTGHLPPPPDFGAPARFSSWRPEQEEALILTDQSTRRFSFLNLPTGSGKSLYAYMYCLMTGKRGVILTENLGLGDQYSEDVGERDPTHVGKAVDIRGANNYPCPALQRGGQYARLHTGTDDQAKCDKGPCRIGFYCPLKDNGGCPYYDQLRKARAAPVVVTNYANWLSIGKSQQNKQVREDGQPNEDTLGHFDVLFLDEMHGAFDQVSNALTVTFNTREIPLWMTMRRTPPSTNEEDIQKWEPWLAGWAEDLRHAIEATAPMLKSQRETGRIHEVSIQAYRKLRAWQRDLALLHEARYATVAGKLTGKLSGWIVKREQWPIRGASVSFQPIWPGPYCERYLFRSIPRVIGMSATIQPAMLRYLGLHDPSQYDFWDFDSSFPVDRRPFYFLPVAFMRFNMSSDEKLRWAHSLNSIGDVHGDEKGIIHTISYDRAKYYTLHATPKMKARIMENTSKSTAVQVERFKESKVTDHRDHPPVLVSPSLSTGYDFANDYCRWQVIGKVPFPDKRDRLVQARCESDPEFAPMLAMSYVVQAYGRIVRSMHDWGTTYMIDKTWGTFFAKWKKFAPRFFREAVKVINSIPRGDRKLRGAGTPRGPVPVTGIGTSRKEVMTVSRK